MITVSRISWDEQLRHSPDVNRDYSLDASSHINISTIAGLCKFLLTKDRHITILDAVPLLCFATRLLHPKSNITGTYGDRYAHILFERSPITRPLCRVFEYIEILDAKCCNRLISRGRLASEYIQRVSGKPCEYIPIGFYPYEKAKTIYLYQGRLRWDKNVEAGFRLLEENDIYIVVGDGPYKKQLQKIAAKMGLFGRVLFVGYVSNPECFWRIADTIVVTRRNTRGNEFAETGLEVFAKMYNKRIIYLKE